MPKRPVTVTTFCLIIPLAAAFIGPQTIRSGTVTNLYGLQEWREEALSTAYTLEAYQSPTSSPPQRFGMVPILPFPFNDILLPGQTKQLHLYEERFHLLFEEALDNHSVVGMGLLAGSGMMTLLPLLEVESFTRHGYDPDWKSRGDGMGNGSIFVTVRAVGRAKVIDELEQEEPYMRARVVEVVDVVGKMNGVGMVKEKSARLEGESSEMEVGSGIAATIETLILSLASMEHRWTSWQETMATKRGEKRAGVIVDGSGNKISRSAVNAQLEALFKEDRIAAEGVNLQSDKSEQGNTFDDNDDADIEETEENRKILDRRSRYYEAYEDAKIADTYGYISPNIDPSKTSIRSLKDLTAISWAVFCTNAVDCTEQDEIQQNVFKIQALDATNVLQRLNLGAAMLQIEKKKLKAKLALAGKSGEGEQS